MAVSKAQQKAVHKYVKENYDRMELTLKKGQKADIKAYAEAHNESMNGFINRAIEETVERDTAVPGAADRPTASTRSAGLVPPGKVEAVKAHLELTGESEEAFVGRAIDARIQGDKTALTLGLNPATGKKMEHGT